MKIEELADSLAREYELNIFNAEMMDDGVLEEFRSVVGASEFNFYINIDELYEDKKTIKKYALGITDPEENEANVIRYDNEVHHNDNPKVQENNPPHHKHIGKDERVFGSSGSIDEIFEGIKEKLKRKLQE